MINREYIKAENKAYDKLVENGYTPQGMTKGFKKAIIFKIENCDTSNEKRDIFYFNNWQEAVESLVNKNN